MASSVVDAFAVIGCLLIILIAFLGISSLCTSFLIPHLDIVQKFYGLSDELVGATVMVKLNIPLFFSVSLLSSYFFLLFPQGLRRRIT